MMRCTSLKVFQKQNTTLNFSNSKIRYCSVSTIPPVVPPISTPTSEAPIVEISEPILTNVGDTLVNASLPYAPQSYHDFISTHAWDANLGIIDSYLNNFKFVYEAVHLYVPFLSSWWATILFIPFLTRFILLPVQIQQSKNNIRLAQAAPIINKLTLEQQQRIKNGTNDEASSAEFGKEVKRIQKEHNVSAFMVVKPFLLQIPIQLGFFFSLLHMSKSPLFYETFSHGGLSYTPDLTVSDPYFVVPILCGLSFHLMIKIMDMFNVADSSTNIMVRFSPFIAGFLTLVSITFPSSIGIYWIGCYLSSIMSFVLMRKVFKIVPPPRAIPIIDPSTLNPKIEYTSEGEEKEREKVQDYDIIVSNVSVEDKTDFKIVETVNKENIDEEVGKVSKEEFEELKSKYESLKELQKERDRETFIKIQEELAKQLKKDDEAQIKKE